MPSRYHFKGQTQGGHLQDADERRQESGADAGPVVSLLIRKAVGTWLLSASLDIPVMGNPSNFPLCIFSLTALIYVSRPAPLHRRQTASLVGCLLLT